MDVRLGYCIGVYVMVNDEDMDMLLVDTLTKILNPLKK